ncbi:MAG: monovalent cation/H+ antiporter complex subunit F [Bacillota bacterium]
MKNYRWLLGLLVTLTCLGINFLIPSIPLIYKLVNVLIFCTLVLLIRVAFGPTPADRVMAVDILGILIIGFCGLLSVATKSPFFMDIAIAWALQSFIGTIAMAKLLEGRRLND